MVSGTVTDYGKIAALFNEMIPVLGKTLRLPQSGQRVLGEVVAIPTAILTLFVGILNL